MTINHIAKNIYSAIQIKTIDEYTIKKRSITSIKLMEVAANKFVNRFLALFNKPVSVYIFCGPGNNGGDGLAIGRILAQINILVKIFYVKDVVESSDDFKENFRRLKNVDVLLTQLNESNLAFAVPSNVMLIDALFGAGINKPIAGIYEQLLDKLNKLPNKIISVDIPSGLHPDRFLNSSKIAADFTITFQYAKLAFLMPENEKTVGNLCIEDIGLIDDCIPKNEVKYRFITAHLIKSILKKRSTFSHKGTFGHCLVVAGSYGKIGAALLCIKSVLKSGAGLVTAHIPKCAYQIVQSSIWEAMVSTDILDFIISETKNTTIYNAVAIGSGLGKDAATLQALTGYLKLKKPTVLDADALNLIAENPSLKKYVKDKVITPHPKEFERLFGPSTNSYERLVKLKEAANKWQCTIILKGAYTAVADYKLNEIYFNTTGNNGLSTAGSGDVLTGIIGGLLAQGYHSSEAAIIGVYLHGLSADIFTENGATQSLLASDIIAHLNTSYLRLSTSF